MKLQRTTLIDKSLELMLFGMSLAKQLLDDWNFFISYRESFERFKRSMPTICWQSMFSWTLFISTMRTTMRLFSVFLRMEL